MLLSGAGYEEQQCNRIIVAALFLSNTSRAWLISGNVAIPVERIIGLPVFSGTPEKGIGLIYFTGPTMGYLIGFLVTVFFAGKFNYNNNIISNFFKLVFATSFIYILGMIWLGQLIGWDKPIFKLGAQPFLLAELFKILIVAFGINQIKKIKKVF